MLIEAQANGLPIIASDSIPSDVNLTSNFKFLSLQKSANEWANEILKNKNIRNVNNYKEILKAGYDIKDVSKFLEKIYLNLYEEKTNEN